MTRARRFGLSTLLSLAGLLALATTLSAQSYFPDPPPQSYRTVLPGSGGTLPDAFVGTYTSPRADSPDHLITVTPYGLASTLCRGLDCLDGSVNFALVECPREASCVFTSLECVGSATRLDDGTLLFTSAPTREGRDLDALGLCTAFAGTARPLGASPLAPEAPEAPPAPTPPTLGPAPVVEAPPVEAPPAGACAAILARAGTEPRLPVTLDPASPVRGNPDALVTIVEFSDFQCPFCGRVQSTLTQLLEEYPDDVRIVFRNNPLAFHRDAPLAHQAALAAGAQGRFWEMHDLLFTNQRALDRGSLESYATRLGLDLTQFRAYLDAFDGQAQVSADQALAVTVGANGTPTFFINGRQLTGAQPVEAFREVIDEELASARAFHAEGYTAAQIYDCLTAERD